MSVRSAARPGWVRGGFIGRGPTGAVERSRRSRGREQRGQAKTYPPSNNHASGPGLLGSTTFLYFSRGWFVHFHVCDEVWDLSHRLSCFLLEGDARSQVQVCLGKVPRKNMRQMSIRCNERALGFQSKVQDNLGFVSPIYRNLWEEICSNLEGQVIMSHPFFLVKKAQGTSSIPPSSRLSKGRIRERWRRCTRRLV